MNLLLDIGNSTIAWAQESERTISGLSQLSYDANKLTSQLDEQMSQLDKPDAVAISSVAADETNTLLQNWLEHRWQVEIWRASVAEDFLGLHNSYADVKQMGVDRWLAMIAAWSEFQTALCVVDCGTALTIDLVDAAGQHAGGYILPGIRLMQQSLIKHTDRINTDIINKLDVTPAANTQQAINNGACLATIAAIEHALDEFNARVSCTVQLIVTGGYAEQLSTLLNQQSEHRPDLVLRGLALAFEASR